MHCNRWRLLCEIMGRKQHAQYQTFHFWTPIHHTKSKQLGELRKCPAGIEIQEVVLAYLPKGFLCLKETGGCSTA